MKRFVLTLLVIGSMTTGSSTLAQTLLIDYAEETLDNKASIHLIESKLPIESEEFNDIMTAKTKLVRTIENYHTDGYYVRSSNVTTHKSGRGYHYHYQYILQKEGEVQPINIGNGRRKTSPEMQQNMKDGPGHQQNQPTGNGQGKVQINSDKPSGEMEQERKRIMEDGKGQVKMIKQPDPVE